ncbi:MAG: class I SAM-dependent methyltransferase [Thermoplasmatota archaeon]
MVSSEFGRFKANLFWHVIDITASFNSVIAELYEKYIGRQYLKEKNTFIKNSAQHILHIGCGAYPITALILAKTSQSKITAIDNNPVIANLAKKVIEQKKHKSPSNNITIEQGDGAKYPLNGFDTIILSSCSYPKKEVLEHVFKKASTSTTIIVRELDKEVPLSHTFVGKYNDVIKSDSINCHVVSNIHWRSSSFKKS